MQRVRGSSPLTSTETPDQSRVLNLHRRTRTRLDPIYVAFLVPVFGASLHRLGQPRKASSPSAHLWCMNTPEATSRAVAHQDDNVVHGAFEAEGDGAYGGALHEGIRQKLCEQLGGQLDGRHDATSMPKRHRGAGRGQCLVGCAISDHSAVEGSDCELVDGRDDRHPLGREGGELRVESFDVRLVQPVVGLVEGKGLGSLSQRSRQQDPLRLPAREALHGTGGQIGQAHPLQCVVDRGRSCASGRRHQHLPRRRPARTT